MKTLFTIFLLLFLTGCGLPNPPFGAGITATPLTEISPTTKTPLPSFAYIEFKDLKTGEIIHKPATIEEYEALGKKDALHPVLEGYEYIGGAANTDNFTFSASVLSDYQFFRTEPDEASTSQVIIKVPGYVAQKIKRSCIVNNKLSSSCLTTLNVPTK